MAPIQIKWLHSDGFRRFELEEPSFASLMEAIRSRIPTFHGGICYTDAEGDKILITCDLDFRDMLKYFRKSVGEGEEVVAKIQTNDSQMAGEQPGQSPPVACSTSVARQKEKIEVIELLESADERNSPLQQQRVVQQQRHTPPTAGAGGGATGEPNRNADRACLLTTPQLPQVQHQQQQQAVADGGDCLNAFMREIGKIDEGRQLGEQQQKGQNTMEVAGHSSWFDMPRSEFNSLNWPTNGTATAHVMSGVGVDVSAVHELGDISTGIDNNLLELEHRMWMKRRSVSNLVTCTQCGTAVTNEHSSLKLHVNLHHLKLPIFSCKYCWKVEHKFSRANMIKHMQREHSDKNENDFDHNSATHRAKLYAKIDECFPEAANERRRHQQQQMM